MKEISVSIIIPTYNCRLKLARALKSIEELEFPVDAFEVIVIDDGSSDGTAEYIKQFIAKTGVSLHYVYQENTGPAAARNRGIRLAKGQYILSIDSDCVIDKNILKHYLKYFPNSELAGVGGGILPDTVTLITKYLQRIGMWLPEWHNGEISYLVTANAFFVKEALLKAGLFDEEFRYPGGEEPELCYRMRQLGYRFEYDKNAIVIHSHRTTFKSMLRMFYVHGMGFKILINKLPQFSRWRPSFLRIILGINSIRIFFNCDAGKLSVREAIMFFLYDYMRWVSFYLGYQLLKR